MGVQTWNHNVVLECWNLQDLFSMYASLHQYSTSEYQYGSSDLFGEVRHPPWCLPITVQIATLRLSKMPDSLRTSCITEWFGQHSLKNSLRPTNASIMNEPLHHFQPTAQSNTRSHHLTASRMSYTKVVVGHRNITRGMRARWRHLACDRLLADQNNFSTLFLSLFPRTNISNPEWCQGGMLALFSMFDVLCWRRTNCLCSVGASLVHARELGEAAYSSPNA